MRKFNNSLCFSATDLVGYINCRHLSNLEHAVADGAIEKPHNWNPLLQILWERGSIHEKHYVDHLAEIGRNIVKIDGVDVTRAAVAATREAMEAGVEAIVQGALSHDRWSGRADVLLRIDMPSALGDWSYEVVDTKLARETKAGTVLQLCLYSELLNTVQGIPPEHMYVVAPWSDFAPQIYRFADFAAYFRKVKHGFQDTMAVDRREETYPDPKAHCDICQWQYTCDNRRRGDDHLCLVAGITKLQINELNYRGIATIKALADEPIPLGWRPERGSSESYTRVREQARLQVEARESGDRKFEVLPVAPGFGLTRLPTPSPGDVFFDLEGDPYVGEHGLEYLFGYQYADAPGAQSAVADWAFTRAAEKDAFEAFVDFAMARWETYPDFHIYHYAPYEPAALKRLMGRYATREEEIDRLLRAGLFVDLYNVVRHAVRASVESYSIKQLEPFYGFERATALTDANTALAVLQANLELNDVPSIPDAARATVQAYNAEDCSSAALLRDWLESLRDDLIAEGADIPRPVPGDGAPNERITDWIIKINELVRQLTDDVPVDPAERTEEQQARWLLANTLDWHRREQKAVWWEFFRLADLSAEDLLDERSGLSGLTYAGNVGGTAVAPVQRYSFPPQETEFRGGEDLCSQGGSKFGKVEAISFDNRTIDVKKRKDTADFHPPAVYSHTAIDVQILADSLVRIGEYVAANGLHGGGSYVAARDLLLREAPRLGGQAVRHDGEPTLSAAVRLASHLEGGILPIQGPPGAGKTYTGARMICELVRLGKTVGITANSHKVIRNLIDATIKAADDLGVDIQCCHKAAEVEPNQHRLSFARRNEDLLQALGTSVHVGGGTAWLWSRPDAYEAVDVLFVDEAAQMSLANVLAVSQAAKTVVLIGDPQQLDQPMQGSHPDGADVSALSHILGDEQTIPVDKGLFLEETWRLHPHICAFTSELFYASKLRSKRGLEGQTINSSGPVTGTGLRYLPIEHDGNQNNSPEEAAAIAKLVSGVLDSGATWIDRDGLEQAVTIDDILIIAPYNAQVFEIQQHLPHARVGTVDKFQGQEAPIAIYSTATSSHADAPRGMEFLYSLNRFNVATSRAKCMSILVSSPQIFEAECRTPRQVQLANAFCRYLELAEQIRL